MLGRPSRGNASELRKRSRELIALQGGGHNPDLVEDIVLNGLKLLEHVEHRCDVKVIQSALRELRHAFRLFAPYGDTRKVTIFASARTRADRVEYQQAVEFGRKAAQAGLHAQTISAGSRSRCARQSFQR
jgi:hypothetical protein